MNVYATPLYRGTVTNAESRVVLLFVENIRRKVGARFEFIEFNDIAVKVNAGCIRVDKTNNARVDPDSSYTYDATFRLIAATGREHIAQGMHDHSDAPRMGRAQPADGNAMARYLERYLYDAAGNILEMKHRGQSGNWTRQYDCREQSQTSGTVSNRLSGHSYDAHGNMLDMPHLQYNIPICECIEAISIHGYGA